MSDTFSKSDRSLIMAKVKSKNTRPEILVRKYLFSKGFRYRLNVKSLPGSPDIVLPKYKTIIFVHGCFWHNHSSCPNSHLPKSNKEYWNSKITKNKVRDEMNTRKLIDLQWNVIIIWECSIKNKHAAESTLRGLIQKLTKNKHSL